MGRMQLQATLADGSLLVRNVHLLRISFRNLKGTNGSLQTCSVLLEVTGKGREMWYEELDKKRISETFSSLSYSGLLKENTERRTPGVETE